MDVVEVRDQNTGKTMTLPKRMYENQKNGHSEWLLVSVDLRNPLKPTPLEQVQKHIDTHKTGCCKDEKEADECCKDTDFIALCRKVENLGFTAEAMEYLESLLPETKEPESKEPEAEPEPAKETKPPKQQRKAPEKSVKVRIRK